MVTTTTDPIRTCDRSIVERFVRLIRQISGKTILKVAIWG